MDISTILIILIHEHGLSFHLCVFFLFFFHHIIQFSVYRFFTSLVKFIPKYFTLFSCYYKWDCSLNFSFWLLLVYRDLSDSCILIWYPVTLLNLLISSNWFCFFCWWNMKDFLYIRSYHVQTESFTSFSLIWVPFFIFCFFLT